ncbi:putative Sterol 4-C-methyltransferase strm-1 [Paratrimastix pyriformis]|uniref:Sterol 4-C-methyltransferase strm-1 n=1 Tax=Paratrimastix pyriformis TaxID=342808 RepID=A0ABQ8UBX8_9EUKA|nr:putative Sterol 4-C-methyltransferase strm-1 [Paratrimastix pyriformis]|eukprot:GAFH01002103.1.p1 GENE.GAFH01002103.1~~GAFH01002103.1.p1  ORF type:complete len:360 (+),score=124.43 GAFH01002103.1:27-1106(+)
MSTVWLLLLGLVAYSVYKMCTTKMAVRLLRLIYEYRCKDYVKFIAEHKRLFAEAQAKGGNHAACTGHFYDLMAELIELYYGPSFHFAPPRYKGQNNDEALQDFHAKVAHLLQLAPGKKCLDLGCGVGGLLRDVGRESGASVTGITLSDEEVRIGNELNQSMGLGHICSIVKGNMQRLPFEESSFDAVYGVYTLKYLTQPELERTLQEVRRVLKPGGMFLVYCLMKTDKYDESNPEHRALISGFEYSCGMPALHYTKRMKQDCIQAGMTPLAHFDSSHDNLQWYTFFAENRLLRFLLTSRLIRTLMYVAEAVRILPAKFTEFMQIFIVNNVISIYKAGSMGIMSGSEYLIFQKPVAGPSH